MRLSPGTGGSSACPSAETGGEMPEEVRVMFDGAPATEEQLDLFRRISVDYPPVE